MFRRSKQVLFTLLVSAVGLAVITSTPLSAGGGAIGMVARTTDSSIGAHPARAYTALFDGDRLVANDMTVVKLKNGSQLVLAPKTVAAFAQGMNDVTVKLEQGTVTLHRINSGPILRVEAGEVLVVPASGFRTLGEIAMRDGMITVKATEGMMFLQGPDGPLQATKGKTITLPTTRKPARAPQPAGAGAGATSAGAGFGHAAKLGGLAAGGASAAVGAASKGGSSSAGGSSAATSFAGGNANSNSESASSDHEHNPIAVDQVANHVPDQACQNAASASVPWVACGPGSGR